MAKSNVVEVSGRDAIVDPLTDLLRTGAEQLIPFTQIQKREILFLFSKSYKSVILYDLSENARNNGFEQKMLANFKKIS